jgi:hypothetical protein
MFVSSRRSAVVRLFVFVIFLCHALPSTAQVSRRVGPHTIEYASEPSVSASQPQSVVAAAPLPLTRLEEQLVVGAANALSHDVRYVCRGIVVNYILTESSLSEWVMERLRRHRPGVRGCDGVRTIYDWMDSKDHLWIGAIAWWGRSAWIEYAPEFHSMGWQDAVQAWPRSFGQWRFVAPSVFE